MRPQRGERAMEWVILAVLATGVLAWLTVLAAGAGLVAAALWEWLRELGR